MPIFRQFCCCELRKGTLWLSGIFAALSLTNFFVAFAQSRKEEQYIEESDIFQNETRQINKDLNDIVHVSATLNMGISFLAFLINGALFYGAYAEKRYFLVPWLVLYAISYSIITMYCIILMFTVPIVILILLLSVFLWYLWLCVLSYYQSIDPRNPDHTIVMMTNQTPMNVASHIYSQPDQPPPYGMRPFDEKQPAPV